MMNMMPLRYGWQLDKQLNNSKKKKQLIKILVNLFVHLILTTNGIIDMQLPNSFAYYQSNLYYAGAICSPCLNLYEVIIKWNVFKTFYTLL